MRVNPSRSAAVRRAKLGRGWVRLTFQTLIPMNREAALLELEFFLGELSELYLPEEAKLWLFSPHKLLDGETAASRIQAGKTQEVFALLDQLRSGAYL